MGGHFEDAAPGPGAGESAQGEVEQRKPEAAAPVFRNDAEILNRTRPLRIEETLHSAAVAVWPGEQPGGSGAKTGAGPDRFHEEAAAESIREIREEPSVEITFKAFGLHIGVEVEQPVVPRNRRVVRGQRRHFRKPGERPFHAVPFEVARSAHLRSRR